MSDETSLLEGREEEDEQTREQIELENLDQGESSNQDEIDVRKILEETSFNEEGDTTLLADDIDARVKKLTQRSRGHRLREDLGVLAKSRSRDAWAEALESMTTTKNERGILFDADDGPYSKRLLENLDELKFDKNGKVESVRYFDSPVIITQKGKISKRATLKNARILRDMNKAREEYDKKLRSVIDKTVGFTSSKEMLKSIERDTISAIKDHMDSKYAEARFMDPHQGKDKILGEVSALLKIDDDIDYKDLREGNEEQKDVFDKRISQLKYKSSLWGDYALRERDEDKKNLKR